MKIKTAFKLSALAVAFTTATSSYSITVNNQDIPSSPNWVGSLDSDKYQYVDVGSSQSSKSLDGTLDTTDKLVQKYERKNGEVYYSVNDKLGNNQNNNITTDSYYTLKEVTNPDGTINRQFVTYTGPTDGTFTQGGTASEYKSSSVETVETIKRMDSNTVKYGEKVSQSKDSSFEFATTTSSGQSDPWQIETKEQNLDILDNYVDLGVVGKNADGHNIYGVVAEKTTYDQDGKAISTDKTELTANGISTTGYVKADSIESKTLVTDSISLAGKDLAQTIMDGDAATLKSAQDFAKAEDAKTLTAAQNFAKAEDIKVLTDAKAYTDTQVAAFHNTTARLNKRIDDVEETAYRGIAIALAAQQQIPNIGAGQFAVFGGVGHYEGESAGALGLAGVLADGRTSLSAALGAAGNGEVGGRLGIAYVFGGNR
ncbi:YadA C-terminal domain-containing protein [Acinetobacter sp. B51(2017)]|uniref:YadA C-terminal domain-containing protein n=1 Tax=Acinetobacter sp. B51(2017) TaxID=2060938 RepID=UPI000F0898B3|nr:YadA C-terminal domain-containing protein [Acinetobacter sp. B51(2017)]